MGAISRCVITAALTTLAAGSLAAAQAPRAEVPAAPVLRAADNRPLAYGSAGPLTADAADAYVDALWFSLAQVGRPTIVTPESRANIRAQVAAAYPTLPLVDQTDLANMRMVVNTYRGAWDRLPLGERQKFVHGVIRLAYGQAEADRVLGVSSGVEQTEKWRGPGGVSTQRGGCHETSFGGYGLMRSGCN